MAKPNPEQGLRILVCSDNEYKVFYIFNALRRLNGESEIPSHLAFKPLIKDGPITIGSKGFEITWVRVGEEVKKLVEEQKPPYYSAVLYDSSMVKENGPKIIAGVRRRDFFIPQVVIGTIPIGRAAESARAGALYFAHTESLLDRTLNNIFSKSYMDPGLTVVKIGGSTFDYDRQVSGAKNLEILCQMLHKIHQSKKDELGHSLSQIILTVGAGQFGDIIKDYYRKYKDSHLVQKAYPELMAKALKANLEQLYTHFGEENAILLDSGAFYYIHYKKTRKKIPLIGMAPHYILARDGIPLQDSDTHTIALAEFYRAEKVVLVKRTDGIYDHDPYLGFVLDPITRKCKSIEAWREAQKNNKRHNIVTLDDLLGGNVSRVGTNFDVGGFDGSTGHLMEDSALEYFKHCSKVKEILVVHIAPEEMHYQVGENTYKHVITGEQITLGPDGWKGVLEQRIRDAFKGIALSKIIK